MQTNNDNTTNNTTASGDVGNDQEAVVVVPVTAVPQIVTKKNNPGFPLHRSGPPSRGPILGRGKGGGVGGKGRIGMRTGTR